MKKLLFCTIPMIYIFIFFAGCNTIANAINEVMDEVRREEATERQASITLPSPTPGTTLTAAQIFEDNADAVFTIYVSVDGDYYYSNGSGFFICNTGIAVTNHHVISGWPYAIIRTHSGAEHEITGFYSYDLYNDLAIIQVAGRRFPYLIMGDPSALRIGENIYTIGSPLGYHNTFSTGIISRFDDVAEFGIYRVYGMIQITAPISGGSSGGALLNGYGQVVGVTAAGYDSAVAQALNFAVPIVRVDLSDISRGAYSQLPIGDVPVVDKSDLVGSWIWGSGYYTFNEDGTGSRTWDGEHSYFDWHMVWSMLVLELPDNETERWIVVVIDENELTIGGAWFTRVGYILENSSTLVGTWDWAGGWYIFEADGTGSREWNRVYIEFVWTLVGDIIVFTIPDESDESWEVKIIDEDNITIGGAEFTRR